MPSAIIRINKVDVGRIYARASIKTRTSQDKPIIYETQYFTTVDEAVNDAKKFCAWKKVKIDAVLDI